MFAHVESAATPPPHKAGKTTPTQAGHFGIQPSRVLVVERDPTAGQAIADFFDSHDCPAVVTSEPKTVLRQVVTGAFSLVILDAEIGYAITQMLRDIRSESDVPVIVTDRRRNEVDCVLNLELGADDCVCKPLNLRELLARARATLRRHEMGRRTSGGRRVEGGYRFEGWEVRRKARALTGPDGQAVSLTKGEYALLVAFLEAAGRILSREQLLQATRLHEDVFDRSIDVQVLRLRRKLNRGRPRTQMIRTVRGVGYVFDAQVQRLF